jgi:hypothetical protein
MEFKEEHILLRGFLGLGDVQIRYYGIIIVVAMLIAAYVAARLAKRSKLDPDHVWGGLTCHHPRHYSRPAVVRHFPAGCAHGGRPTGANHLQGHRLVLPELLQLPGRRLLSGAAD